MAMQQGGKAGVAPKPPEPMCPMCGSPMAKSPLGVSAHRELEGTLKQMHAAARRGIAGGMRGMGGRPGGVRR